MGDRYRNAAPIDLGDYLLPATLHQAATDALASIGRAATLAQVKQCLAAGLATVEQLDGADGVHTLDLHFVRGILTREADLQHGRVWPQ